MQRRHSTNPISLAALLACLLSGSALLGACSGTHSPHDDSAPSGPTSMETSVSDSDAPSADPSADPSTAARATPDPQSPSQEIATLGAGCFWCVEAVLEQLDGVFEVGSGYMGGHVENPTYKQVCAGTTGHAEVVQVVFDPSKITYREVLSWFWRLHDPTTLNRQGNDVGTQYRSAIFYHDEEQRRIAEESKAGADASGEFDDPIVTEITAASTYYPAEEYHQDYYRQNKSQGYCRFVISPKLEKLGLEK